MEQPHMRLFYCRRPTAYARLENVALCKFGTRVVAARKAGEVSSPITVPSERTPNFLSAIIVCLTRTLAHGSRSTVELLPNGHTYNLSVARHKTHMDLRMTSRSRDAYSGFDDQESQRPTLDCCNVRDCNHLQRDVRILFQQCKSRRRRREPLASRLFRQPRGGSAATGMVAHVDLLSHQRVGRG